jgi:GNAT superfamily N-acetyltransferase
MTVASPHEVAWTTARPEENGDFVAFVDACFGRPEGRSLRREFPTALAADNARHQFEGSIDGRRVCAATALVRPWTTTSGRIVVGCVGCFATAPAYRGQGMSGRLQGVVLEHLRREGVEWAALWTDRPEIYARRGFRPAGAEVHGRLDAVEWPRPGAGDTVRPATADDAPAVLRLYGAHALRAERTESDVVRYLGPSTSRTWVLERGGRVVAYASLGKGDDFPGYVHDYGGAVDAVHALWGVAVEAGARAVLLPAGTDAYRRGPAAAMPGSVVPTAMIHAFDGAPRAATTEFAVWGFDSA